MSVLSQSLLLQIVGVQLLQLRFFLVKWEKILPLGETSGRGDPGGVRYKGDCVI